MDTQKKQNFFCVKCHTKYNISTDLDNIEQEGGNTMKKKITQLLENGITDLELSNTFLNTYNKSSSYRDLIEKDKKKINKLVKAIKINNKTKYKDKYYLKCPNCLFYEDLQPGYILYKNDYIYEDDIKTDDLSHMINDPRLLHFREYVCKNDECITHKKIELKDAVLIPNRIKQITIYICTVCKTQVTI